ncbi:MAG TPA: hypothetical protein VFD58_32040 [Blastocatellia bacterium]|nr:hypothetical protein [Blastocatellia bacterium]
MTVEETLTLILDRLTALEAKSYDTRPLHDETLAGIAQLSEQITRANDRLDRIDKAIRQLDRRFDSMSVEVVEIKERVREIEEKGQPPN